MTTATEKKINREKKREKEREIETETESEDDRETENLDFILCHVYELDLFIHIDVNN